ncbi:hypothetical protein PUNSTDRAFT_143416 [Punctularia strigosozonata HHB-11173 SS5]|uniref:uncharacterized protein n=1 Tax=Punctularia strigosozonata (strain HHB-11173) TaxID=741275 RepID=UPI00044176CF|nr:uncharacterized protein PUNSTDRAFT_143416 [Punctularia strigosozonata HHB-11173 SS5]EIN10086.1 hypothetical protein PUNSTDRAFT_143416 [Punctularia strigosozonata HHB-11173 SS5]
MVPRRSSYFGHVDVCGEQDWPWLDYNMQTKTPTASTPLFEHHMPSLEEDICSDFTCCGLTLADMHQLVEHFEEAHVLVLDGAGRRVYPSVPSLDTSSDSGSDGESSPSSDFSDVGVGVGTSSLVFNYPQPHPPPVLMLSCTAPDPRSAAVSSSSHENQPSRSLATPEPMQQDYMVFSSPSSVSSDTSVTSSPVLSESPMLPALPMPSSQISPNGGAAAMDTSSDEAQACVTPGMLSRPTVKGRKGPSTASKKGHRRQLQAPDDATSDATGSPRATYLVQAPTGKRARGKSANRVRYACPTEGCTKLYLNPGGLKYHLEKGTCSFDPKPTA